jgi:hypothetical protein
MVLPESIMYLQEHAQLYYKVMKMKYPRYNLTHKAIKLLRQAAIKLVGYGTQIQELKYRY